MSEATSPVHCMECGMPCDPAEYHPYAACLMFKACHNSETVRANLPPQPTPQRGKPMPYKLENEPPTRTWTSEKPTKPGYYWWRSAQAINGQKFSQIVKVTGNHMDDDSRLVVHDINPNPFLLENASGDWYGPLDSPPQE